MGVRPLKGKGTRALAAGLLVALVMTVGTGAIARPRVGLALSGGGATGFVHIGVLKVLEQADVPIDCIAGTSMGCILGGLYAIGYTPAELESLAVRTDWSRLFSDELPRRRLSIEQKRWISRYVVTLPIDGWDVQLPSGLIAGQNLSRLFSALTLPARHIDSFHDYPIPFTAVTTDIVTGDAVVLDRGYLSDAMRASMAVPSIFTPVRIDGHLLLDGGLTRHLPAEDVRRLGADIVIGVDVAREPYAEDELDTFIHIVDQVVRHQRLASIEDQRALCDILIRPDIGEPSGFDFDEAAHFIARGESAARDILPRLRALVDSIGRETQPRRRLPRFESATIDDIELVDMPPRVQRLAKRALDIRPGEEVDRRRLDRVLDRLQRTQLFERVSVHLRPVDNGERLVIRGTPTDPTLLRVGLRYDSRTDAAMLLNTTFQNLLGAGTVLTVDLRLGEDLELEGRYVMPMWLLPSMGWRLRANVSRTSIDVFDAERRVARFRTTYSFGELFLGSIYSDVVTLGAGLRAEHLSSEATIGAPELADVSDQLMPLVGQMTIDTFDRAVFPRSGVFVSWTSEVATRRLVSDFSFSRHVFDGRIIVRTGRDMSILGSAYVGTTSNGPAPPLYQFVLGGFNTSRTFLGRNTSFLGLKHQERVGRHIQAVMVGAQYEFRPGKFVVLRANAGNTFEEWPRRFEGRNYIVGGGVTLGVETVVGPVELSLATGERHDALTHVSAGFDF